MEDVMGILKKVLGATALAASLAFAGVASAGVIPYPNPGTVNPDVYVFTAASTGDIHAFSSDQAPAWKRILAFWSMAFRQE